MEESVARHRKRKQRPEFERQTADFFDYLFSQFVYRGARSRNRTMREIFSAFYVRSYTRYKSARMRDGPRAAPPTVPPFRIADRPDGLSHKTPFILIGGRQKLLGQIRGSPPIDLKRKLDSHFSL
jgi:hypothetical protein